MRDREVEGALEIGMDVLERDTNVAARHASARTKLRQHDGGAVDRHGEPDAARARADRGVDADHLAARVDERTAAVAEVDRGVGLNVVVEADVEQLAAEKAHDTDRDGVLVAERITD